MSFAKLYGEGDDQVLVMLGKHPDDDSPEVRFYTVPPGLGVCSIAAGYEDSEEGWDAAEAAFARTDEELARGMVSKLLEDAAQFAPDPSDDGNTGDSETEA